MQWASSMASNMGSKNIAPQMQWPPSLSSYSAPPLQDNKQYIQSLSSPTQTVSTMPDASGGYYPSSAIVTRVTNNPNQIGDETAYAGASVFDQSILSPWGMVGGGSPWGSVGGRSGRMGMGVGHTPPNGQGGG